MRTSLGGGQYSFAVPIVEKTIQHDFGCLTITLKKKDESEPGNIDILDMESKISHL